MKLGSRVIDSARPGQVGVFNGFQTSFGRKMALVKFPGAVAVQVPADRVTPEVAKRKTGPKPVAQDEWNEVAHRYGYSRSDVLRIARGNGVTVRQAVDDLLECEEGCECEHCMEAAEQ